MAMKGRNVIRSLIALVAGIGTGILTLIGQKYLPGSLNSLANSGAVWLIPAFFVAWSGRTAISAVLLCAETLAACVVSYYLAEAALNAHAFSPHFYFWLWLACAAVFGAVFGLGAYLRGRRGAHSHWGAGLLPAVFLSEGLSELIHLPDYAHMIPAVIGRIIVGLALYGIIYRRDAFRKMPLVSFGALSALGVVGYELLFRLTA